jgi:hypothetical protein
VASTDIEIQIAFPNPIINVLSSNVTFLFDDLNSNVAMKIQMLPIKIPPRDFLVGRLTSFPPPSLFSSTAVTFLLWLNYQSHRSDGRVEHPQCNCAIPRTLSPLPGSTFGPRK